MTSANTITALILAGGAGRRVGYRDKGLIHLQGRPLIAHVSDALKPHVSEVLISCNRNVSLYQKFASRTVTDTRRDFQGPLAGLEAASAVIATELLVVVSCDMPHLPDDLVERLIAPLSDIADNTPDISYAHDGMRAQYLCAGMRKASLSSLPRFLDEGQRAVQDWYRSRYAVAVDFSDRHACFRNYNRLTKSTPPDSAES
jgi:molybdopterin-guanine dinucleotide biosynthesis protein A